MLLVLTAPGRIPVFKLPFWSVYRSKHSLLLFPRRCLSRFTFGAALGPWRANTFQLRTFILSTRFKQETVPCPANQRSLNWTRIHETCPASLGISTCDGYHQLISPDTRLPCRISETLVSAFDYIGDDTIRICCGPTLMQAPVEIAKLKVLGIRKARKEDTKMEVTMVMNQDLTGKFTARFTPRDKVIEGEASVDFDGSRAANQKDGNDVVTSRLHCNLLFS